MEHTIGHISTCIVSVVISPCLFEFKVQMQLFFCSSNLVSAKLIVYIRIHNLVHTYVRKYVRMLTSPLGRNVLLFEYISSTIVLLPIILLSVYKFVATVSLYNTTIAQGYSSNVKCNCCLHVQHAKSKLNTIFTINLSPFYFIRKIFVYVHSNHDNFPVSIQFLLFDSNIYLSCPTGSTTCIHRCTICYKMRIIRTYNGKLFATTKFISCL